MTTETINIHQELLLNAPREKVWRALTTPEGWASWFGPRIEGTFEIGERVAIDFNDTTTCFAIIVEKEPMERFAYKWHPGEDCLLDKYPEAEMTLVSFTLEDAAEGATKLTMVESGFERIPDSRRDKCVLMNTDGWKWELEEFRAWVENGVQHSKKDDEWTNPCGS